VQGAEHAPPSAVSLGEHEVQGEEQAPPSAVSPGEHEAIATGQGEQPAPQSAGLPGEHEEIAKSPGSPVADMEQLVTSPRTAVPTSGPATSVAAGQEDDTFFSLLASLLVRDGEAAGAVPDTPLATHRTDSVETESQVFAMAQSFTESIMAKLEAKSQKANLECAFAEQQRAFAARLDQQFTGNRVVPRLLVLGTTRDDCTRSI
jgi:hypothetical protein